MLEISKYIRDLLYLHDCVIIPDFGGFVANYKSAQIDSSCNVMYPPSKDIGFNCNLYRNDGLLIKYLADAENLEYAEAEKSVNFFVEDMKVQLQRGETVTLEDIGSFYNDRKFNLQFTPKSNVNYLVAAYGFNSLEFTSLSSTPNLPISTLVAQSRPITMKRLGYISVAAACLFAVVLSPTSSENSRSVNSAAIGIETNYCPKEKESNVCLKNESVVFHPEVNKKVETVILNRPMFYLVAGCFSTKENAVHLRDQLIAKSYPATVFSFKNLHAVAVNQFKTKKEAIALKQQFQNDWSKISCWILKK